jgi:hypothetical protein
MSAGTCWPARRQQEQKARRKGKEKKGRRRKGV